MNGLRTISPRVFPKCNFHEAKLVKYIPVLIDDPFIFATLLNPKHVKRKAEEHPNHPWRVRGARCQGREQYTADVMPEKDQI